MHGSVTVLRKIMEEEGCPICFDDLDISGTSEIKTCRHTFHTNCIKRWAAKNNSCPACRSPFNKITTYFKGSDGKITSKDEHIENAQVRDYEDPDENPNYICHICFVVEPGDDDRTLLCEGCDMGYHMECLNPPLLDIPEGDWFCPTCTQIREADEGLMNVCNNCFIRNDDDHETIIVCDDCQRGFHPQCVNNPAETDYWFCRSCSILHNENDASDRISALSSRRRQAEVSDFLDHEHDDYDLSDDFLERDEAVLLESDDFVGINLPAVRRRVGRIRIRGRGRARTTRGRRARRGAGRRAGRRGVAGRGRRRARTVHDQHQEDQLFMRQILPRLGITSFSDDIGDLDESPSSPPRQNHASSSTPTSSSPPKATNPTDDLLGNILEEQQKALAPGALFMQKNGKFIPREKEFKSYLVDASTKEANSKQEKTWPGLTSARASIVKPEVTPRGDSQEGRSDGRTPVPAWPLKPTRDVKPLLMKRTKPYDTTERDHRKRPHNHSQPSERSFSSERPSSSSEPAEKMKKIDNNNIEVKKEDGIKKEIVEALTIPSIDKICKGVFDKAFKKWRIDKDQYKKGMKYVVKHAYSFKWQKERIVDECRKFIQLAPFPGKTTENQTSQL